VDEQICSDSNAPSSSLASECFVTAMQLVRTMRTQRQHVYLKPPQAKSATGGSVGDDGVVDTVMMAVDAFCFLALGSCAMVNGAVGNIGPSRKCHHSHVFAATLFERSLACARYDVVCILKIMMMMTIMIIMKMMMMINDNDNTMICSQLFVQPVHTCTFRSSGTVGMAVEAAAVQQAVLAATAIEQSGHCHHPSDEDSESGESGGNSSFDMESEMRELFYGSDGDHHSTALAPVPALAPALAMEMAPSSSMPMRRALEEELCGLLPGIARQRGERRHRQDMARAYGISTTVSRGGVSGDAGAAADTAEAGKAASAMLAMVLKALEQRLYSQSEHIFGGGYFRSLPQFPTLQRAQLEHTAIPMPQAQSTPATLQGQGLQKQPWNGLFVVSVSVGSALVGVCTCK
jgi:hypothetical protein